MVLSSLKSSVVPAESITKNLWLLAKICGLFGRNINCGDQQVRSCCRAQQQVRLAPLWFCLFQANFQDFIVGACFPLLCISGFALPTPQMLWFARVGKRACSHARTGWDACMLARVTVRFFQCHSLSVLVLGSNQIAAKGAGKLAGVLAQCQHSCTLSAVLQGSSISSERTTELPRGNNKRAHNNGPCGEFAKHRRADSESESERCDKGARRE